MSEIEVVDKKKNFLSSFNDIYPDEFLPKDYPEKSKKRLNELVSPDATRANMIRAIPMTCKAYKCDFADSCKLLKEGLAPEKFPCPYEAAMVIQFMGQYMEQLEVDESNLVEVCMVRDLVDIDVQQLRKTKFLAKDSVIQENVVGVDQDGVPIMKKELHLAVLWDDKLLKRKSVVIKQLLASRESKAKAGLNALDPAMVTASLMNNFREIHMRKQEMIATKVMGRNNNDIIDLD